VQYPTPARGNKNQEKEMDGTLVKCPVNAKHYIYALFGEGKRLLGIGPCGDTHCKTVIPHIPLPEGYDPRYKRFRCKNGHYFWAFPAPTFKDAK
jgi:hypothetical protein